MDFQYLKKYNDKNIMFYKSNKKIIMGGFFDGKIFIISTEPKVSFEELIPITEESQILSLAI
jgi:hypothetical protein